MSSSSSPSEPSSSSGLPARWVSLNVGGRVFVTTHATLTLHPNSFLASLSTLLQDAAFFGIEPLVSALQATPDFATRAHFVAALVSSGWAPASSDHVSSGSSRALSSRRIVIPSDPATSGASLATPQAVIVESGETNPRLPSLRGVRLNELDLACLDLSGANLQRAHLTGTVLDQALMVAADLRDALLAHASLVGTALSNVDARKACLPHASLDDAILNEANFSQADLSQASLVSASARNAYFQQACLAGADLSSANLEYAKLQRSDLRGADLTAAALANARFTGADLRGAKLDWASADVTAFRSALLTHAEFDAIDLDDATKARFKFTLVTADYERAGELTGTHRGIRYVVMGTAAEGLRLRAEPRGDVVALIPEGTEVVATGDVVRSRAFTSYHIEWPDRGLDGWVISMFLNRIPGQAPPVAAAVVPDFGPADPREPPTIDGPGRTPPAELSIRDVHVTIDAPAASSSSLSRRRSLSLGAASDARNAVHRAGRG
ncbi:BTB/POZ domain-containing protein [Thecamonas trahens ATCC 50062]|uniref:BTB/POZ domain-containing protein n=1 Tax=Thecamonas trahens ATCC 50062 TaxID=461836 RepID=A0A0L0DEV8_THETB|nr:BTB/POZ domain-containing protein [Thecamonas trahens ATCC 50062]KNC50872.1 BTB/POZ domain-containing protein [Thecamonas trahens ATCC 50062]|eukprot:XP_013756580.1 BTB/POZ domain-containing protein [Thecamonas trahens ATCC 50062]